MSSGGSSRQVSKRGNSGVNRGRTRPEIALGSRPIAGIAVPDFGVGNCLERIFSLDLEELASSDDEFDSTSRALPGPATRSTIRWVNPMSDRLPPQEHAICGTLGIGSHQ
jgi:hypothetical protein